MRHDGREPRALRPVNMEVGWHGTAEGSVLIRSGNTTVLCTASVEDGVKSFLEGQGRGWVTAEYLMHPRASGRRQARDGFNGRPLSGRTQEIARLIGRALRGAVDARVIGERTITIDCDVLEADGGTRTASVTGGMVALIMALDALRRSGVIAGQPLRALVAAVSTGLVAGQPVLDLAYVEDRDAEMDMNVVATDRGEVVEIQATAEGAPVARATLDAMTTLALDGIAVLCGIQKKVLAGAKIDVDSLRVA